MVLTKQAKEGIVPMKLNKKVRLFLVGSAVASFGVFAVSSYINENAFKDRNILVTKTSKEVQTAFDLGNSLKHINTKSEETKTQIAVVAEAKTENQPVLNRGGSGIPEIKEEPITKTMPKVVKKTSVKTQTVVRSTAKANAAAAKPAAKPQTVSVFGTSYKMSFEERELFYRLVNAETEGEPYEGKLAVATVIVNRLKSAEYPNTIRGVIMDNNWGYQFTPVIDGRINNPASAEAKRAVDEVIAGKRSFSSNVLYFVNPDKATNSWIMQKKTYLKTIGKHDFYY
jgi:spore germination cell wall hydrolase CwlJ-like protein